MPLSLLVCYDIVSNYWTGALDRSVGTIFSAVLGSLMSLQGSDTAVRKENKLMRAYFCSLLILILLFSSTFYLSTCCRNAILRNLNA